MYLDHLTIACLYTRAYGLITIVMLTIPKALNSDHLWYDLGDGFELGICNHVKPLWLRPDKRSVRFGHVNTPVFTNAHIPLHSS